MTARGPLSFWKIFLGLAVAGGAYAVYVRLFHGLAASTNLSDAFPWGLWVGFDVLVGVGLAAGGFVTAAAVHVFRMEKYEPITRPTVLTAFLGYLLVGGALALDIGQPWRIWHPLVFWNPHSVMFEVSWCVVLYLTVLALEFSPMLFERLGWKVPLRFVNRGYVLLVVAGCMLSTLHQSSLGSVYLIAPDKLHGLWYSSLLPIFFFITAVAAGLAMTIFESCMSHRAFGRALENDLLQGLARALVVVLGIIAVLKFEDLGSRGNLGLAFQQTQEAVMFWGEMGLGVLLPLGLLAIPKLRKDPQALFFAATLVVMGFVLGRMNVSITGMMRSAGVDYFPAPVEIALSVAVCAVGFTVFALAVKYLPIFPESEGKHLGHRRPLMSGAMVAAFWVFAAIGLTGTALAKRREPARPAPLLPHLTELAVPVLTNVPAPLKFKLGEKSPGVVAFRHTKEHVNPKQPSCRECHEKLWRVTEVGTLQPPKIHDACGTCHNGDKTFHVDDKDMCETCHEPPDEE